MLKKGSFEIESNQRRLESLKFRNRRKGESDEDCRRSWEASAGISGEDDGV